MEVDFEVGAVREVDTQVVANPLVPLGSQKAAHLHTQVQATADLHTQVQATADLHHHIHRHPTQPQPIALRLITAQRLVHHMDGMLVTARPTLQVTLRSILSIGRKL